MAVYRVGTELGTIDAFFLAAALIFFFFFCFDAADGFKGCSRRGRRGHYSAAAVPVVPYDAYVTSGNGGFSPLKQTATPHY